jgi:hypothetical protein
MIVKVLQKIKQSHKWICHHGRTYEMRVRVFESQYWFRKTRVGENQLTPNRLCYEHKIKEAKQSFSLVLSEKTLENGKRTGEASRIALGGYEYRTDICRVQTMDKQRTFD